jgi:predicted ATPase
MPKSFNCSREFCTYAVVIKSLVQALKRQACNPDGIMTFIIRKRTTSFSFPLAIISGLRLNCEKMNEIDNMSVVSSEVPIFGREKERSMLEDVYQKSMKSRQVVWISGSSGVGKSALTLDFFHDKKNVCIGKFDCVKSSVPYSAIVKIMIDLSSILEGEFPPVVLGPEFVSILSTLLPKINLITTYDDIERKTGSQKFVDLENKVGEWGFQKLKQGIRSFLQGAIDVVSHISKHPVILHFDDLQWADEASLEVLKYLYHEKVFEKGLLFVGSYRDNEIDKNSMLLDFKTTVGETKCDITEIFLGNLALNDVVDLISNLSLSSHWKSQELGRLVYDFTQGNALFVRRYLYYLIERNLIIQSESGVGWDFDNAKI